MKVQSEGNKSRYQDTCASLLMKSKPIGHKFWHGFKKRGICFANCNSPMKIFQAENYSSYSGALNSICVCKSIIHTNGINLFETANDLGIPLLYMNAHQNIKANFHFNPTLHIINSAINSILSYLKIFLS